MEQALEAAIQGQLVVVACLSGGRVCIGRPGRAGQADGDLDDPGTRRSSKGANNPVDRPCPTCAGIFGFS